MFFIFLIYFLIHSTLVKGVILSKQALPPHRWQGQLLIHHVCVAGQVTQSRCCPPRVLEGACVTVQLCRTLADLWTES